MFPRDLVFTRGKPTFVALGCVGLITAFSSLAIAQDDVTASLAASNERIRARIQSLRIEFSGKRTFFKGSYNELVDLSDPGKRGTADLPAEDIVLAVSQQTILDFPSNRSWSKAIDHGVIVRVSAHRQAVWVG